MSADPVHQEGIDHIKENVGDKTLVATSAGTEGATDFTPEPVAPVSATEAEPTTTAAEPTPAAASHTETSAAAVGTTAPAETAAAAPAAAAVGEATPATAATTATETPSETAPATSAAGTTTPTNQKRKSIIGSFKGMLGLADGEPKKSGERKRSLADRGKGSSTPTEPTTTDAATSTTAAGGAPGEVAKDSTAAEAETTAADNKAVDPKTDTSVAGTETAKTEEDAGEQKPKTAAGQDTKALEHPSAIPEAGGEKLGEKHWGESKIIPPDPKSTEESGVASADGQPTSKRFLCTISFDQLGRFPLTVTAYR